MRLNDQKGQGSSPIGCCVLGYSMDGTFMYAQVANDHRSLLEVLSDHGILEGCVFVTSGRHERTLSLEELDGLVQSLVKRDLEEVLNTKLVMGVFTKDVDDRYYCHALLYSRGGVVDQEWDGQPPWLSTVNA